MYLERMIVLATHEYQWMLWPFSLLLWKYWKRNLQIIYYGDRVEGKLPPGVEFRVVPIARDRPDGHWNWHQEFGSGFASVLRELDDPIVAISLPDMWLVGYARLDKIDALSRYMESNPGIVHAAIGSVSGVDEWSCCIETWEDMDIMTCSPRDNFHGGLMVDPSLWNRKLALELIENVSIWDFERMGKEAMEKRPDLKSIWAERTPNTYPYVHVSHRSESNDVHLVDVRKSWDRKVIKAFVPGNINPKEV